MTTCIHTLCTCSCSKKVVTQSGGVTVGVERVNGTQLTATVQYATVELTDTITIGQLALEPAQFGVHYTGTSGSLTFPTSTVSWSQAIGHFLCMHNNYFPYIVYIHTHAYIVDTDCSRHCHKHYRPGRDASHCFQCYHFDFSTSVSHIVQLIIVLCDGTCVTSTSAVRNSVATVVLYAPGPLSRLIDIYFNTLESTTVKQLERCIISSK